MMIVDAHLHLWVIDPDQYPWQPIGGYIPEKEASLPRYLDAMASARIDRAVLVQPTPYGWDNSYLLACKNSHPEVLKAVVLVDPFSASAADSLTQLAAEGADGLRINLQLEAVEKWDSAFLGNLFRVCAQFQMPVCFQATPDYFTLIKEIGNKYQFPIVIDHLGRPTPGAGPNDLQFKALLALSDLPNVFVKLSGMNYYSQKSAPYADTWELLKAVKAAFKADHCIWGSDFPFILDHWSFNGMLQVMQESLDFDKEDLSWILGGTAESIWWSS